jgi:hypothetical protein
MKDQAATLEIWLSQDGQRIERVKHPNGAIVHYGSPFDKSGLGKVLRVEGSDGKPWVKRPTAR